MKSDTSQIGKKIRRHINVLSYFRAIRCRYSKGETVSGGRASVPAGLRTVPMAIRCIRVDFIGRALQSATDFFGGLGDEVGNGRANEEDDVRKVRRAMTTLGRMEEPEDPEDEPSGIIDRPLDTALRGFQRDKGLRVDGFMRPDGPTEQSLGSDLKGLLGRKSRSFDGVVEGTLNPAAALRAERDDDAQSDARSLLDRAPEPDNRSSSLLDLATRALSGAGDNSRPEQDQAVDRPAPKGRGSASVLDTETDPDASDAEGRSRDRTATALAPKEKEPASLKPFLDKTERNLGRTHEGWHKLGMTDAARHLKHFLDGSGEPITYNRDQARSFGPVRNAEEDARSKIQKQILERAMKLKDGESINVTIEPTGAHGNLPHGLDLLRGLLEDRDRFNDNLATGKTSVKSSFKGTIRRNGDETSVDGLVDYDWDDTYDFHLPQPGAAAAKSLEQYRGARTFTFGSDWQQRLGGKIQRTRNLLRPSLKFTDVH